MSPISNEYIPPERAQAMESFYPLHAYVCDNCFLVQLQEFEQPKSLFSNEYAYFSSYSDSWLQHSKEYADTTIRREGLGPASLVIEVASNDGYLLQYFQQKGISVLGVEPTANTARVALETRGVPSEIAFFGRETAERLRDRGLQADVMAANNVLAHVPDLHDFVSGYPILLKKGGVANFEFPHLLSQIENSQFDTIYHEHFSYLSLTFAKRLFSSHGLRIYDVEELATHGGSLRLYVCHDDDDARQDQPRVAELTQREVDAGLGDVNTYRNFSEKVLEIKLDLIEFLVAAKRNHQVVAAYGAPAKGVTLLNYCGIGVDLVPYTVDRSPYKCGKLMPGVRTPIMAPQEIFERKPDYLLILAWNLKEEIIGQMSGIRSWGGKFVVPIPRLTIYS
jgi:SAM-dependent methyltransferase